MQKFFLGSLVFLVSGALFFAQPPQLANRGNTCFMNALIQALNALVPARNYLVRQGPAAYQDNPFLASFVELLTDMQKKQTKKALESFVDTSCPRFEKGRQDDAARLFTYLIDEFKEARHEQQRSGDNEVTYAQFFAFTERVAILCDDVEKLVATNVEHYLKLPVVGTTLQDGFKEYLINAKELENFRGRDDCFQKTKIATLPEILVIALNRFEYVTGTGDLISKKDAISIPTSLTAQDLRPLLYNQNTQIDDYALVALVMHHGPDLNSGHYTAYVRDLDGSGLWYLCDDDVISVVGPQLRVISDRDYQEDGYMFFYMAKKLMKQVEDDVAAIKKVKHLGDALSSLAYG